jgi:hypothetical protein
LQHLKCEQFGREAPELLSVGSGSPSPPFSTR